MSFDDYNHYLKIAYPYKLPNGKWAAVTPAETDESDYGLILFRKNTRKQIIIELEIQKNDRLRKIHTQYSLL